MNFKKDIFVNYVFNDKRTYNYSHIFDAMMEFAVNSNNAKASRLEICFNNETISFQDDGHGLSYDEINNLQRTGNSNYENDKVIRSFNEGEFESGLISGGMGMADNLLFLSKKKEMYSLMFVSDKMKNCLSMNGFGVVIMEFNQKLNPLDFYALQKLKIIETYSRLDFNALQGYLKKITTQSGSIVVLKDLKENKLKFSKEDIICDENPKNSSTQSFKEHISSYSLNTSMAIYFNGKKIETPKPKSTSKSKREHKKSKQTLKNVINLIEPKKYQLRNSLVRSDEVVLLKIIQKCKTYQETQSNSPMYKLRPRKDYIKL